MLRRRVFLAAAAVALPILRGAAQTNTGSAVAEAVRYLASSAMLQNKMSSVAASRDTRPEVKAFAAEEARAAEGHLEELRTFSRARSLALPQEMDAVHKVIWDNIEPLDYLALTRRYAEMEQQALERDVQMYEEAAKSPDADVQALAAKMLPGLRRRLEQARQVHDAVKP
jgi:putative membrane protein